MFFTTLEWGQDGVLLYTTRGVERDPLFPRWGLLRGAPEVSAEKRVK